MVLQRELAVSLRQDRRVVAFRAAEDGVQIGRRWFGSCSCVGSGLRGRSALGHIFLEPADDDASLVRFFVGEHKAS